MARNDIVGVQLRCLRPQDLSTERDHFHWIFHLSAQLRIMDERQETRHDTIRINGLTYIREKSSPETIDFPMKYEIVL